MTETQAAKVNNVLVSLQLLLDALEDAEVNGVFARKVKQSANRLKGDIESTFDGVFKDVSTIASDYYIDLLEFMKQQGIVFARVWDYSEENKMKFYLALQNFYTVNLKKPKDARREEAKAVDK
jgi:peptide subunit release factor 1 (eRF1)